MGKAGTAKGPSHRHLHARIAYLDKAARYLAELQKPIVKESPALAETLKGIGISDEDSTSRSDRTMVLQNGADSRSKSPHGLPFIMTSHLRAVSQKSVIRLSQDLKRSICKACNGPMIDKYTSRTEVENLSNGAKKPWADVCVLTCSTCGTQKRFPVGAKRQQKKAQRKTIAKEHYAVTEGGA